MEQLPLGAREFKGGDAVAYDTSADADPTGSGASMPTGSLSAETQTTNIFYFPVERIIVDKEERLEKMSLDMIRLLWMFSRSIRHAGTTASFSVLLTHSKAIQR